MAKNLRLDDQLCFSIYAASHAFTRFYKPRLDALDLTYPQYLVFLVLWEEDGLTVKALGDRLFLDSGTITPLVKRLEARGLLMRKRDEGYEVDLKLWGGLWMLERNPDGSPLAPSRPADGTAA